MTVPIDKGIPMPKIRRYSGKYDFRAMEVSVPFDGGPSKAASHAHHWGKALGNGTKFASRKLADGTMRIWRVK